MYCPQCGQQQVSDVTRYCSRCGFPLDGITAVLVNRGALPTQHVQPGHRKLSPRSKGVRQGALLMLSTILLVPLVGILGVVILNLPAGIVGITAVSCFLGGLLRIFYALLMEDSVAPMTSEPMSEYAQPGMPQFGQAAQNPGLPPASAHAAPAWRSRPNTAEIYEPRSVTENTTRLLDNDDTKNR